MQPGDVIELEDEEEMEEEPEPPPQPVKRGRGRRELRNESCKQVVLLPFTGTCLESDPWMKGRISLSFTGTYLFGVGGGLSN